ncbi:hypothetical protein PULV_a2469 [Pseudoalteromonas ulvae UL12]|uniref:EamA family transporter n=1 Tax=Pseudoalteromonas ulvae TaxID=107327 RepID=A0A2C9ZZF9_PSEDV|nr:DMT family transporter [Pseudoalteromonas ulvae]MBE0364716.1 hypothetical protein [Pseudoalteromonas ulvae UL12]OUL56149.1 EamA family transporter [Pseudoalteromonas ulvae]
MKTTLLYLVTVLIWGSTWFAIEFQLGDVAVEVSLFYRFALAAALMWIFCTIKKLPMRYPVKQHGFFILLAVFNFGANYLILYWAQAYLTSAMTSIAFSLLLLMNIINTRIFFGKPIALRIYLGACLGVIGIIVLFWADLADLTFSNGAVIGLLLSLAGTFAASIGNMISVRNSHAQIPVLQGNAWGMLYSAVLLLIYINLTGAQMSISTTPSYLISLIYLSVFGTVIAFGCYFALLKEIGPEKASYVIVLFPLVAVVLSTYFEGFIWTNNTILGFSCVLLGNAIVLTPVQKLKALFGSSPVSVVKAH